MSQDRGSVGVSGLQVLEEWFLPRLAASTSATRCGLTAADDEARANLDETLHTRLTSIQNICCNFTLLEGFLLHSIGNICS